MTLISITVQQSYLMQKPIPSFISYILERIDRKKELPLKLTITYIHLFKKIKNIYVYITYSIFYLTQPQLFFLMF